MTGVRSMFIVDTTCRNNHDSAIKIVPRSSVILSKNKLSFLWEKGVRGDQKKCFIKRGSLGFRDFEQKFSLESLWLFLRDWPRACELVQLYYIKRACTFTYAQLKNLTKKQHQTNF